MLWREINERSFSLTPRLTGRALARTQAWTGWTGRSHQASERLVQQNTVAGRPSLARHALLLNPECWHALRARIAALARSTAPAAARAEHGPARAAGRWRMSRLMPGSWARLGLQMLQSFVSAGNVTAGLSKELTHGVFCNGATQLWTLVPHIWDKTQYAA